jgi:hypothetical protein
VTEKMEYTLAISEIEKMEYTLAISEIEKMEYTLAISEIEKMEYTLAISEINLNLGTGFVDNYLNKYVIFIRIHIIN